MPPNSPDVSEEFSSDPRDDDTTQLLSGNTDVNKPQETTDFGTIDSIPLMELLQDPTYTTIYQLDSIEPVVSSNTLPIPTNQILPIYNVGEKPKAMFVNQPIHYRSRFVSEFDLATPIRCNGNKPVAIEITGLKSDHGVVVLLRIHCVQCDDTYRSHPNNSFLRENGVTNKDVLEKGGVVTCTAVVTKENNQILLDKLAVLRATRRETGTNLMVRHNVLKNSGQEGQINQYVEQPNQVDCSQFRICAEVFIGKEIEGSTNEVNEFEPLEPIFSDIIKDIQAKPPLHIAGVSDHTTPQEGGKQVFILCNKIGGRKEKTVKNVEVHLTYPGNDQPWGKGKIKMIHHQVAIVTTLPQFPRTIEPDSHFHVKLALYRQSKGSEDEKYSNQIDMVYYSGTLKNSKCMNPQEVYCPASTKNSNICIPTNRPCVYSKENKEASACETSAGGNVPLIRGFSCGGNVTVISSSMNRTNCLEDHYKTGGTDNSPSTSGRRKHHSSGTTTNLLKSLMINETHMYKYVPGSVIPKKRTSSSRKQDDNQPSTGTIATPRKK